MSYKLTSWVHITTPGLNAKRVISASLYHTAFCHSNEKNGKTHTHDTNLI